jgi:hypothetical protein
MITFQRCLAHIASTWDGNTSNRCRHQTISWQELGVLDTLLPYDISVHCDSDHIKAFFGKMRYLMNNEKEMIEFKNAILFIK